MDDNGLEPAVYPPVTVVREGAPWWLAVVTGLLGVALGMFGSWANGNGATTVSPQPSASAAYGAQPNKDANYVPRNDAERLLFTHLRPATIDEQAGMVDAMLEAHSSTVTFASYVATGPLDLPDNGVGESIIIGIPHGTKWVSGKLGANITLVFAFPDIYDLPLAFAHGAVIYNPVCNPAAPQMFANPTPNLCGDLKRLQPATKADMLAHLKPLTFDQASPYLPYGLIPKMSHESVYITTGDVRLATEVTDRTKVQIIILADGTHILGGMPGTTQVVTQHPLRNRPWSHPGVMHDPFYTAAMTSNPQWVCDYVSATVEAQVYPGACTA